MLLLTHLGRFHTLILGPKGAGKSELLHWMSALEPTTKPQLLWTRLIYHEANHLMIHQIDEPREVHSSVKPAHLLGTYQNHSFRAGELALAHGGMLLADEFLEWPRDSKECLREPLQKKRITLNRVQGSVELECDLQLIATGNLCPCGGLPRELAPWLPGTTARCRCDRSEVRRYLSKLSGPILDRMDLVMLISGPGKPQSKVSPEEHLKNLQHQLQSAMDFGEALYSKPISDLEPLELECISNENPNLDRHFSGIASKRSQHKLMKLAIAIQSLEHSEKLLEHHVMEAKSYRLVEQIQHSIH
jgi:magnesium chelatase family protein